MAPHPRPAVVALPEPEVAPARSVWQQPRGAGDSYVEIERRELPALTSLRFFAAIYVVVHHLVNVGLLHAQGADADRDSTWYLAWATQGHVGVTFFFVLSGFILAWCYHRTFAHDTQGGSGTSGRRFWRARFARVWPLHAAMFLAFVPLAILEAGRTASALGHVAWTGALNLSLLHAWIPWGGPDGLADTFNAPSWTLSVEALFYLSFPFIAVLLVRRLRWGVAQLALLALGAWLSLGIADLLVADQPWGDWAMRVFPLARLADFLIGVAIGLAVVQGLQRRALDGRPQVLPVASSRWTVVEAIAVALACLSPLAWALVGEDHLPATFGTSWFHLPWITAAILVLSLERGAISRRVLAIRPLVWLGEVSYALYLVHLFIVLAAYRIGAYDVLGPWLASILLVVASIAVAGFVHERFEKPARARLVASRRPPAG